MERTIGSLGSVTQYYLISSWKFSLHALYLLPVFPPLRRMLPSTFHSPCRYSDVTSVSGAQGKEILTLHRVSSIPRITVVDFHQLTPFFLVAGSTAPSLRNKSSFHVGEWWKETQKGISSSHSHSLTPAQTLNPVLWGLVMYCVCRFIKHALHHTEVPALLHVHMLSFIINTVHLCVHSNV